ncbi:MAG TPA: 1-acyl-sn-glycerol-3-phosphate acyltransferase [Desulfobulbaceae bacterium]|nr:1-acyl-sn-glycerol-3-phosphate acyltransferase [Desulfobulbaceae bacterium]
MSPIPAARAVLLLILGPPLTLLFSTLAWIDLALVRHSQRKGQLFPTLWARSLCRIAGVRVRVLGTENLAADQTYIFMGNHVSQFDIFAFQGYSPHDFRWIVKKELFRIPVFGAAMRRAGLVPIDRSHGREAMRSLIAAAEHITSGTSVLIFPEGTRSLDGTLQPFKAGVITLAIKAGVPVVPVGFIGTYEVLPKGRLIATPGEVIIRIGKPISIDNYSMKDKHQLAEYLHDRVAELLVSREQ